MKNPAESMAGTTPTFSVPFSAGPKFVGRVLTAEVALADEEDWEEQPAASPASAVSATAPAAVRLNVPKPVNGTTPH
jgi:hypothetical protein